MEKALNKGTSAEGISRAPRSLRSTVVARLLAGTMALSAAALAACSSDEIVNPELVGGFGDSGADGINLSNDSTSTVGAASDTTATTDGGVDIAEDATTVTADASSDTSSDALASDTSNTGAETASSTDASTGSTAADTISTTDTSTPVDTSNNGTDIIAKADTTPSGPKQICEAAKAKMISALKPGAPECTETIPGVGKIAGKLVCDGTNLEANCVIN